MKSTNNLDSLETPATPKCATCSDTGYVGCDPVTCDLPEGIDWKDRQFCDCAEGEDSWQSEQDDAAYSHAERCFTDHGYAMGN